MNKIEITEQDILTLIAIEMNLKNFNRCLKTSRSLYRSLESRKQVFKRTNKSITNESYIDSIFETEIQSEIDKTKLYFDTLNMYLRDYNIEFPDFDILKHIKESCEE